MLRDLMKKTHLLCRISFTVVQPDEIIVVLEDDDMFRVVTTDFDPCQTRRREDEGDTSFSKIVFDRVH